LAKILSVYILHILIFVIEFLEIIKLIQFF